MADLEAPGRDPVLYQKWHDWVTVNLGRDVNLAAAAANAAADAAADGRGFNAAAEAARRAWSANKTARDAERSPSRGGPLGLVNVALGTTGCVLLVFAALLIFVLPLMFATCQGPLIFDGNALP